MSDIYGPEFRGAGGGMTGFGDSSYDFELQADVQSTDYDVTFATRGAIAIGLLFGLATRLAALGGLLLGLAESLAVWKLDPQWSEAVTFVILFVFIIFRPAGFMGRPHGAK